MNWAKAFWQRICVPLDGFLWHRDITHSLVRPALRNQILVSGACILAGAMCFAVFPWLFWFGSGLGCMTWIFWSWARFFLKTDLANYSAAFLRSIILRFVGRLALLAVLLYLALALAHAPAGAMVAGMIAGSFLGLGTFAFNMR